MPFDLIPHYLPWTTACRYAKCMCNNVYCGLTCNIEGLENIQMFTSRGMVRNYVLWTPWNNISKLKRLSDIYKY